MTDFPLQGFILHATYRLSGGGPQIQLAGRLADGRTFLVKDRRSQPYFWIPAADSATALPVVHATGGLITESDTPDSPWRSLDGRPVVRVVLRRPGDAPRLRDQLQRLGVDCLEADVRFAMRYLMDRDIRGSVAIMGAASAPQPGEHYDLVFQEPQLAPGEWSPTLTVLCLDIETTPSARRLLSVALHGCGAAEVLMLGRGEPPSGVIFFESEAALLTATCRRIQELDPDVLSGWAIIDFDLPVLLAIAGRVGVGLTLGRTDESLRISADRPRATDAVKVSGRVVLDAIRLLRGAFLRFADYSLETVASEVLGEGKTIRAEGEDRARAILDLFRTDPATFARYNLTDARLVSDILTKLKLIEFATQRSRLTGLPPDRVGASIAAFDFLYLSRLRRHRRVAPSVRPDSRGEPGTGGHVLPAEAGLHDYVLVFDFKSLYPSIIRTFCIDPLGWVAEPAPGDPVVVAPNGASFRRGHGILPKILDELFPRRAQARQQGDIVQANAIKILMNSFYGVLGAAACRFHNPSIANAITSFGKELLLWTRDWMHGRGHRVLYGDTDSLFVASGEADVAGAQSLGGQLAAAATRAVADHIKERWHVISTLELEFEHLYLRLFVPSVRDGSRGATKRYVGLVAREGLPEVVFTGMEVVRRDWTELAHDSQRELYRRLFLDEPVSDWLRQRVSDVRAGHLDPKLVYRKGLRKPSGEYTALAPHVVAARLLERHSPAARKRRSIEYVITREGPHPVALPRTAPIDYEHYVEKQLRPVAEPVLHTLGLSFDRLTDQYPQLGLFD